MGQHEYLRERWAQHAAKNNLSKFDDAEAKKATEEVVAILSSMYPNHTFSQESRLSFKKIEDYSGRNFTINYDYANRRLEPDGGVIWMDGKYPILISEMKRQGTNDERIKEGKKKQAVGNAIERLGKNLIGFKNLYENDDILPFCCFCWGCDVTNETFLGKLYTLNSFYELNIVYDKPNNYRNKPFTCILKEEGAYTLEELVMVMLQVAVGAIEYYTNKEN
jgi:type II restriction enzyme